MQSRIPSKKPNVAPRAAKRKLTKAAVTRQATETAWWQIEKRKFAATRLCDRCEAVWFDGHWHTAPGMAAMLRARKKKARGKDAKPFLCYECRLAVGGPADAKLARYGGQLTLDGLDDPKEKAEILATARNFGTRAQKRDPEARIISIDDRGARVVIDVTENQMAAGMGKAVHAAHKGGTLKITWSKDDLPVRVQWTHKPKKK